MAAVRLPLHQAHMASSGVFRRLLAVIVFLASFYGTWLYYRPARMSRSAASFAIPSACTPLSWPASQQQKAFSYDPKIHSGYHGMDDEQCDAAFPGLFDVLDESVASREDDPIELSEIQFLENKCLVRVLIYEGEIFIVQGAQNTKCWMGRWHERTSGLLHSLHRAISAAVPSTIPNAEFLLDLDDDPQRPVKALAEAGTSNRTLVWGLTRQADQDHIWLMPDYGYWAWPSALVGSHAHLRRQMAEVNAAFPWSSKVPKAIWRGTTHLNPGIREPLVQAANGKQWADVQVCDIYDPETAKSCILPHEHCRYALTLHTEGYTYSGRLKYLQLCESAPIIHELTWQEHHTHLLRSSGDEQNYIPVHRDWHDLESQVELYLGSDDKAHKIAKQSYETFAQRYLTPAATSCYWRRLVRNWASVQGYKPQLYNRDPATGETSLRGIPFEAYAIDATRPMPRLP